jgi:predicted dehydrogenase
MNSPLALTRRGFLHRGGRALAFAAVAGSLPGGWAQTPEAREAGSSTPTVRRKIRLGVVGCGKRGSWITGLFQKHGGYEIRSVADYFPEAARECGEQNGVSPARQFSGLSGYLRLLESGVEAVALETPPWFFPEHARAAVAAGLHVFMAKPIAVDVPGVLSVEAAARTATGRGKVFLVDYQIPTDPENQEVVRLIRQGAVGKIALLASHYFAGTFADPPLTDTIESRLRRLVWVNDVAIGGGYHVNACIHALQAGLWVAGQRPVSASGVSRIARSEPHGDSHDIFALTFEFEDGLIWSHRGKHLKNLATFDAECGVQGSNGYAQISYTTKARLRSTEEAHEGNIVNLYEAGAVRNIAAFYDQITRGECVNNTVAGAVDSTLIAILGREACARRTKLTLAQLLSENRLLNLDLRGLKA